MATPIQRNRPPPDSRIKSTNPAGGQVSPQLYENANKTTPTNTNQK